MNLKSRKIISIALVFFMMLTILPLAPVTAYAEGSGDDCYIDIGPYTIDDLNVAASGSGTAGTWTYTPGDTPTITLNNYKGGKIHLHDLTPEDGVESYVKLKIEVNGDCEITASDYGIFLETDTDLNPGKGRGASSRLYISFSNNASLTINADLGIQNKSFFPRTWIQGSSYGSNANLNINAASYGIRASGSLVKVGSEGNEKLQIYGGEIYIDNGLVLDVKAPKPFSNGGVFPSQLIVNNGAMVSMTSTTGADFINDSPAYLYSIPAEYTAYKNASESELLIYVPAEPVFTNQNPKGNDDETTALTYTAGDTVDFTFDGYTPNGFTVKKSAKLRGLFAGLDADQKVPEEGAPAITNGAATLTHPFGKAGLYQLTETLDLYFGSQLVGTKTHNFLIEVAAKPLVTPTITQQPNDVTNASGDSVTLTAKAKDAERARWYVQKSDGTVTALDDEFAADGTSTQTVSKASNAVGNRYYCAFWSKDGKIAQTKLVTVCFAPTVKNGSTVTVNAGQTAYLKVTASGCNHYASENGWYAPGASSEVSDSKYYPMGTTLCVSNVTAADAGVYTYKYVTEHGDVVTGTVELVVNASTVTEYIDTFDIIIDEPVYGKKAPTTATVPSSAEYKVKEIKWTGGVSYPDSIINNSSAYVNITLEKTGTKQFKSQYSSGNLIGSVNGLTATAYGCDTAKDEITVTITFGGSGTSHQVIMPEPDSVSVTTETLTFEKDKEYTASDNMKIIGTVDCDHNDLAEDYQHTGMIYSLESTTDNNAMPTGLTLNQNGSITGTPTAAGTYTVVILAHSANGNNTPSTGSGHVVKAIKIIVEDKDAHTHDWDIEHPEVVTTATCEVDGKSKITCSGCTETVEITTPATGHNWGKWPTYMIPTCQDDPITITRTCANDPKHTESITINPIHMAMDWTTDKDGHWKVCDYCETEILVEKDAHKDADSDNKCDICKYDMTPAVQPFVDMIVISDVIAPEAGTDASIAPNYVVDSARNYTVEKAEWWMNDSDSKATEFVAGTNYRAVFTVVPKEGVVFDSPLKVKINGNDATVISSSEDKAVVSISLTATYKDKPSSGSSSGGGFSGSYNYPVIVGDTDGADVAVSDEHATKGEKITITVKPDAGKQVDEVIVTDADGDEIAVTKTGDNEYTFTMPASKVTVAVTTEAADYGLRIVMQINNKNILVNGVTKVNDVAPVIVADRTLVPIRVVTELLGGSAHWDNATRTVTLKIDGKTMNMTIGKEIPGFGTSAVIMNDRTYVPVRYVMEKLGAEVEWIGATRQIIIEK